MVVGHDSQGQVLVESSESSASLWRRWDVAGDRRREMGDGRRETGDVVGDGRRGRRETGDLVRPGRGGLAVMPCVQAVGLRHEVPATLTHHSWSGIWSRCHEVFGGVRGLESGSGGRWEMGDGRWEMGDGRRETGDVVVRRETGDRQARWRLDGQVMCASRGFEKGMRYQPR